MTKQIKKKLLNYIVFSSMAIQMATIISIFTYLGIWLDNRYQNQNHLFTMLLSLIGVFGAIYKVISQVIAIANNEY